MSAQPGGGQPGQPGQPNPPQPPQQKRPPFFKPEQMKQLPPAQFTAQDKEKYENGLRNLWKLMENHTPETKEHQDAKKKISDFSNTLYQKIRTFQQQQQAQAAQAQAQAQAQGQREAQQNAGAQQGNTGAVDGQIATQQRPGTSQGQLPAQNQQAQQQGGDSTPVQQQQPQQPTQIQTQPQAQPQPQQRPNQPQIPKHILDHVNNFPYHIPPQFPLGSNEAIKHKAEQRQKLVRGLLGMETAKSRVKALDEAKQARVAAGNPLSPEEEKEYTEKKEAAQKGHADAARYVENFRAQNIAANAANVQQVGQPGMNAANNQANQGQAARAPNPALQSTQTVNAAIEAARNQQLNGGRSLSQSGQGQQIPPQNVPNNMNMPQQTNQVQNPQVKQEPGAQPPQINTAVNQFQNQHRNSLGNNSPQSALPQSAIQQHPPGPPRALSHAAALSQANRSYSSGGNPSSTGPSVMGHSHPTAPSGTREPQNVMTSKMPIPKHLPERAQQTPQPVVMAPSRPSYTGGPGNGNAIGGQPVIQQHANVGNLAENGGRVLDKNKLEELVRQVTGGGQGLEGGGTLTPDVESVSSI